NQPRQAGRGDDLQGRVPRAAQEVAVAEVGGGDRVRARREGARAEDGRAAGERHGAQVGAGRRVEEVHAAGRRAGAGGAGAHGGREGHRLARERGGGRGGDRRHAGGFLGGGRDPDAEVVRPGEEAFGGAADGGAHRRRVGAGAEAAAVDDEGAAATR